MLVESPCAKDMNSSTIELEGGIADESKANFC